MKNLPPNDGFMKTPPSLTPEPFALSVEKEYPKPVEKNGVDLLFRK